MIAQTASGHAEVPARPPRWAFWAAWAVPLCLLPSSAWRAQAAMATGLGNGGWYLLVLSGLEVALGLLALGLVYRWGEALPRWVPVLGGRHIHVRAAVIPASLGAIAVTLLSSIMVLEEFVLHWEPQTIEDARVLSSFDVPATADLGGPEPWVAWLYVPALAWGPLLALVTWAYYRRRTRLHKRESQ